MNFRILAGFIAALGGIIALVGGFQWLANEPRSLADYGSSSFNAGGHTFRDDFSGALNYIADSDRRARARDEASGIMIAGAIVLFVGLGVFVAANQQGPSVVPAPATTPSPAASYCPGCGSKVAVGPDTRFCENCGRSLEGIHKS